MKKAMVCAVAVCLSLTFGGSALAQSTSTAMMGKRCISPWEMFKFMRDIKITDSQKEAFKTLMKDSDTASEPILTQLKEQSSTLTDALLAADIDTAAAESQIDAILVLETQLSDIALHARLGAAQTLTADQRALILDMVNKIRACEKARQGWMNMKKPAYFSLIMPEKSLQ